MPPRRMEIGLILPKLSQK